MLYWFRLSCLWPGGKYSAGFHGDTIVGVESQNPIFGKMYALENVKTILTLFLLCSCSTLSLDEQYDEAVACEVDCDDLWARYEAREKVAQRKKKMVCPNGYVLVTNGRWESCISPYDASRMLGGH